MVFEAINFTQSECGSKIKGSKKRFVWTFKINGIVNTLELVASFVSGKRRVLHNEREIYQQKELLNVKFEFSHKIENHMFRILQRNNRFELLVDSCSFETWIVNKNYKKEVQSKPINFNVEVEKQESDPFAEFGKVTKKASIKTGGEHNAFGDFNFDFPASSNQSKPSDNAFGDFGLSTNSQPQGRPSLQKTNSNSMTNDFFSSPPGFSNAPEQKPLSQTDLFGNPMQTMPNPERPAPKSNEFNLLDL